MSGTSANARVDPELEAVSASVLRRLQEQTGDDDGELLRELVDVFLADADETCGKLAELLGRQDAAGIGREAHRLKSGAANLGAQRMTDLCKLLELAGNAGEVAELASLLQQLTDEVPKVQAGLEEYVKNLG